MLGHGTLADHQPLGDGGVGAASGRRSVVNAEFTGSGQAGYGRTRAAAGVSSQTSQRRAWPAPAAVITVCGAREPTRE